LYKLALVFYLLSVDLYSWKVKLPHAPTAFHTPSHPPRSSVIALREAGAFDKNCLMLYDE